VTRGLVAWLVTVALGLAGLGASAGCGHPGGAASFDAGDVPTDVAAARTDAAIDAPDASPFDPPPAGPDLQFISAEMTQTATITRDIFSDSSCEVMEGCVGGSGPRLLLRFDTVSANRGTANLALGAPPPAGESNTVFEWSQCHGHHHVRDFASYELLDATGTVVLTARKQSFCLEDVENIQPGIPAIGYSCSDQGITRGWADVYSRFLPCQWIDVTNVQAGTYTLRIVVNPLRTLPESNYDNNTFTVSVVVPSQI
jgi:lysyl oxidase